MSIVKEIESALECLAIPEKRDFFPYFFKTGKGEYAEGDQFIGVTVPDQRKIVKAFWDKISLNDLSELLQSKIHEHRHTALLILVMKYERAKQDFEREVLVQFYLDHLAFVNNWDLVDNSCYKILGHFCFHNEKSDTLITLSESENMWHQRIAIVATMYHIKQGHYDLTKVLALKNLSHPHDLMHKANGWLLREMGKKDEQELLDFLDEHYTEMPRTTLRYAIEKMDEDMRQDFLKGRR